MNEIDDFTPDGYDVKDTTDSSGKIIASGTKAQMETLALKLNAQTSSTNYYVVQHVFPE